MDSPSSSSSQDWHGWAERDNAAERIAFRFRIVFQRCLLNLAGQTMHRMQDDIDALKWAAGLENQLVGEYRKVLVEKEAKIAERAARIGELKGEVEELRGVGDGNTGGKTKEEVKEGGS